MELKFEEDSDSQVSTKKPSKKLKLDKKKGKLDIFLMVQKLKEYVNDFEFSFQGM